LQATSHTMDGCVPIIRPAQPKDFNHIIQLARTIAGEGDAFPWEDLGSSDEEAMLAQMWLPEPAHAPEAAQAVWTKGQPRETFVCELDGIPGIVGAYTLQPSGLWRCSHIARCAYMVAPEKRRCGLGKQMCSHSLREAKRHRYLGVQLDMVVSTNAAAIGVLTSCGFKIMCTLPRVFRHARQGLVGAHVMFHDFSGIECGKPKSSSAEVVRTASNDDALVFTVGEDVRLLPQTVPSFKVHPPLPQGMHICSSTGIISGMPSKECQETTYQIIAGEARFQVLEKTNFEPSVCINEVFAAQLENVTDLRDMPKEPFKSRAYGDWMIWMVHRAWLNDPTLLELNFNNMHMPEPHVEPRIAPKLMKAMQTNSHLEVLSLSNANMQKIQAIELATALCVNCSVRTINLESNCLDSNSVRQLANSIAENSSSVVEQLRFSHQRQMGNIFFGRPAEEAVGMMMQKNMTIVKLGFECDDAHWRNEIDRALLRNNDRMRRRMQGSSDDVEKIVRAEEKSMGQMTLHEVPLASVAPNDFFSERSNHHSILRAYMAQNLQLPTPLQLQQYAKSAGTTIPYTQVAPLIKECRAWILQNALDRQAMVVDAFGVTFEGKLSAWNQTNECWSVDINTLGCAKMKFKADKEPVVFLSPVWEDWLSCSKSKSRGGA